MFMKQCTNNASTVAKLQSVIKYNINGILGHFTSEGMDMRAQSTLLSRHLALTCFSVGTPIE